MPIRFAIVMLCSGLLMGGVSQPVHAHSPTFQAAREQYELRNWQAAEDLFLEVAQGTSDADVRNTARFYAGECALQLKNFSRARANYQHVLNSGKPSPLADRARFRLAESLFHSGSVQEAEIQFQQFVDKHPHLDAVGDAYNYLAEISLQNSRLDQALAGYGHVIENFAGAQVTQARLGMARALLAGERHDEVSLALGRLCVSNDPLVAAEALLTLGRAQYEGGNFEDSLATFRRVYELSAEGLTQRARLAGGWALWKLARWEEVAAEIAPLDDHPAYQAEYAYLLGMTAYCTKDWAAAIPALQTASAQQAPHRAAALFYWGESALRGGNPKLARSAFQKLLDVEPTSEWADDALWGLACAAKAAKSQLEYDQACDELRTRFPESEFMSRLPPREHRVNALRRDSPDTLLFDEAAALERDGRFDAALSAYHELIDAHQTSSHRAEGLWRVARLHHRLKQHAEARDFYLQLLDEYADFVRGAELLAHLAAIEDICGNSSTAANYYRNLVQNFPQTLQAVEASYWLALVAADDNKVDEAQWQIDWLLERLNPASRTLNNAERHLYEQALCLECQLLASENKWHEMAERLDGCDTEVRESAAAVRLAFWRAEAAARLGEHADAHERFRSLATRVVGINESWVPMVTLRRAQLAARQEQWQHVLELVDELALRYAEFELVYEGDYLRGRSLAGRGDMSAARAAYGRVLENDRATGTETAAMAQWMIGETYFHQRNYEQARAAYVRVIERHFFPEWQARAALQAGKCAELDDDWQLAAQYYTDAIDRWPETSSSRELAARLKWLDKQMAHGGTLQRR